MTGYEGHTPAQVEDLRDMAFVLSAQDMADEAATIAQAASTIESLLTRVEALETLLKEWLDAEIDKDWDEYEERVRARLDNGNGQTE